VLHHQSPVAASYLSWGDDPNATSILSLLLREILLFLAGSVALTALALDAGSMLLVIGIAFFE